MEMNLNDFLVPKKIFSFLIDAIVTSIVSTMTSVLLVLYRSGYNTHYLTYRFKDFELWIVPFVISIFGLLTFRVWRVPFLLAFFITVIITTTFMVRIYLWRGLS
jgi:hypothetical protein